MRLIVSCEPATLPTTEGESTVKFRVALAVAAMVATGVVVATPANAWPTPPPPGCEQRPMVAYCDGPVQADGSWQRCFDNQPMWNSSVGWVGGSNCYQVGPGPDPYPWAPQYHIG